MGDNHVELKDESSTDRPSKRPKTVDCQPTDSQGCQQTETHGCQQTETHGCQQTETHGCQESECCEHTETDPDDHVVDVHKEASDDEDCDPDCDCVRCTGFETLDVSYWDNLYSKNYRHHTNSEYLLTFPTLQGFILPHVQRHADNKVLVPGCGDSMFSLQLHDAGIKYLVNTDISEVAIDLMEAQSAEEYPDLEWVVDDATSMQFKDGTFGAIVDKSLIDCIYWVNHETTHVESIISAVLSEYHRVLDDDGTCVIVTMRGADEFLFFLDPDVDTPGHIQEERADGSLAPPDPWEYTIGALRVETTEDGAVPRDAPAVDVTDVPEEEDPARSTRFYVYQLQKKTDNRTPPATNS